MLVIRTCKYSGYAKYIGRSQNVEEKVTLQHRTSRQDMYTNLDYTPNTLGGVKPSRIEDEKKVCINFSKADLNNFKDHPKSSTK